MQQILELVHIEGNSEVWRPVPQGADCMQFSGTPRLGDFMIEREGHLHFLRPEAKEVRIKSVKGDQLQVDLEAAAVPNWFVNLMHTHQINFDNNVMNLNGAELKDGVLVVFDGKTARVEEPSSEIVTHH